MLKGYPLIFTEDKEYHEALKREAKHECCPIEIIGKDEKRTGKFICLFCGKPVEVKEKEG